MKGSDSLSSEKSLSYTKKNKREAQKALERAEKEREQRDKDAAVDVDICKPETWTSMVKDHNTQTNLSY